MKRKPVRLLLSLVGAAVFGAAAAQSVVTWSYWGDPGELPPNFEVIEQFEAANPDITKVSFGLSGDLGAGKTLHYGLNQRVRCFRAPGGRLQLTGRLGGFGAAQLCLMRFQRFNLRLFFLYTLGEKLARRWQQLFARRVAHLLYLQGRSLGIGGGHTRAVQQTTRIFHQRIL